MLETLSQQLAERVKFPNLFFPPYVSPYIPTPVQDDEAYAPKPKAMTELT